ncbi:MAG: hypothetical protein GOVbin1573_39 [Prokaryotic dsDNA virus sp.]|nr:MAG: hypothetical protein GOVbin1573_39 [Prokaryotic dsDNA virus sp.]
MAGLAFRGREGDLGGMDPNLTLSVAGGVIIGLTFILLGLWSIRLIQIGRWRVGVIVLLFVVLYGGVISMAGAIGH